MAKRIITSVNEFETWKSTIDGQIWVTQFDRRGDTIDTCITGGRELKILPEERKFNQERVADERNDPFMNGLLVPVKLVESAEDFEDLAGNPNHLTEKDMAVLLDDPTDLDGLVAGISKVKNPTTLLRLINIAEGRDATTLKQMAALQARLQTVSQQDDYEEVDQIPLTTSEGRTVVGTHASNDSPAPMNPNYGRR